MAPFFSSARLRTFMSTIRPYTKFTLLTCILLALGSIVLGLEWMFSDFFVAFDIIGIYSWAPLIVLLSVAALLISDQWINAVREVAFVIVSLCAIYYLLRGLGLLALPSGFTILMGMSVLILLNGCALWVAHRSLKASEFKRKNISSKKRLFLKRLPKTAFSLAIGSLFIKTYLWDDPSKQWLLTDLSPHIESTHKLTLASLSGTILDDASHLNRSVVSEIRSPKTVAEVIQAIKDAKSTNRKISLSGIRHSMGGQALGLNTLHLDMTQMDSVRYNASDQTITVGPGATWKQVQAVLSPHGRAVRVMQDSNIFSVGGSLSVNAHGKDPQYGSLIESVNSLNIVTAEGKEIRCGRTHNQDLFSAVIGGYGLLGIITEVNLLTTQNSIYSFSLIPTEIHRLIDMMETLSKNPETRLLEAHLSIDQEHFLTDSLIFTYADTHSTTRPQDDLSGENSIWLRKVIFQISRMSNVGKILRWEMEKLLSPLVEPKTVSRNTAMAVPVRFLQNPDPSSTDILQEYFIPTEQIETFLEDYKRLVKKYKVNVLNVTIRKVAQDTNALVSYAQKAMYGFVVYYKVQQDSKAKQTIITFTEELVEYLISIKATYYLCYGGYYSPSQLSAMYPTMPPFLALKAEYDSDTLFTNAWYEKYLRQLGKKQMSTK